MKGKDLHLAVLEYMIKVPPESCEKCWFCADGSGGVLSYNPPWCHILQTEPTQVCTQTDVMKILLERL